MKITKLNNHLVYFDCKESSTEISGGYVCYVVFLGGSNWAIPVTLHRRHVILHWRRKLSNAGSSESIERANSTVVLSRVLFMVKIYHYAWTNN